MAIDPAVKDIWMLENFPITLVLIFLIFTFKHFRLSNAAYTFIAFWLFTHTIGGHYTFSNVPFNILNDFFSFEKIAYFTT